MNVKIVYDNEAKKGFIKSWGFSCLIENHILFDVGWDPAVLLHNLSIFGISMDDIDTIILSHQHWDHIGSLPAIMKGKNIYVPASFSSNLKKEISSRANLFEIRKRERILGNIFSSGILGEEIKEQSLYIENEKGTVVVTGCAHPGLENILPDNTHTLIGGFHGFDNLDLLGDIERIIPCHCTVKKKEIVNRFENTEMGYAGMEIIL